MISTNDFLAMVLPPLEEGEHYCSFNIDNDDNRRQFLVPSIDEVISKNKEWHVDAIEPLHDGLNAESAAPSTETPPQQ